MGNCAVKILLVDDEFDTLEISKGYLERDKSFCVEIASSVVKALDLIDRQEFDIIVSDYQMPGQDGIQLLKKLRAVGNRIPFILFTGRGREEIVIEALNNGADFYLQKGGDMKSQFAELSNMIKQAHTRREGENTLKISEERYRSLFENSIDAVMLITIDGAVISANPSACKMLGMTEDELRNTGLDKILLNDESWAISAQKLNLTGLSKGEYRFVRKNGTIFMGDATSGLFTGLDNKVKISMIIRDITKSNENRERLEMSELRYRRLFETAQDGILILDYHTEKIIDANKFILDLTGYSQEVILDRKLWELGFIEDKVLAEKAYSELRKSGYVRYENIPLRRMNGETISVEFISNAYMVKGTKIVQCNIRDTSVHQLRDRLVKELARIVDSSGEAIIGEDLNGTISSWNKAAEMIFGYSRDEIVGQSISILAVPDGNDEMKNILKKVSQGVSISQYETVGLTKDGRQIQVSLTISPFIDEQGRFAGVSTFASDITSRKNAETALQEVNRKLNLLSSVTRHDINNQLMVLMGNLNLMDKEKMDAVTREHVAKAETSVDRISAMIRFTKEYEDIGGHSPTWQDVRTSVNKASENVHLNEVMIINDIQPGFKVYADPLISKVFYNLMHNAVRHGGKITTIRFSIEWVGDAYAIICEDDGTGITLEMREMLFTRGYGRDHGLGLFLSREILSITGITIDEMSLPGHGARFVLKVPTNGNRIVNASQ